MMAGSVEVTLTALAVMLLAMFTGGQAQCYTGSAVCSGASTALTTAEECCLGDGQSYNEGSTCEICYVIRYRPASLTLSEGDQSTLTVEVFKPPAGTGSGNVAFTIMNEDNSADVRVGGADNPTGTLLFNFFGRDRGFTIRAEADQIGQEGTETITIPLVVTSTSPTVFVGPPATVTVIDQSVVLVELTEADYQQREGQGNNVITARVLYNREIANPITVTFFPVTYDRYLNGLNLDLPSSFPGREVEADDDDFNGSPITITLPNPAGGTVRQVELQIPINDDMINEHQETLVGFIEIANAVDEGTIQLGRTAAQLIIDDNDDITIGFTEESYTFTEGQSGAFVTLAKDAGRISQRTDIAAMISLGPSPSATPDSDFSITLLGSDIDFNPSDQSINIPLSILEDSLPEGVESFTLSVVSAGNFPFGAARTDTSPTTQVIITDNDDVVVGFEQTIYTVPESAGSIEVCAVVTNPPMDQPLSSSFTLLADTLPASAVGGSDYTDFSTVLPVFDNNNRRRCFDIAILEDNLLEASEMFRAFLTLVSGSGVNVDPAEATITITDVDTLTIGLQQTMYTVNEGDPLVSVCAEVTSGAVGRETIASLASQQNTATPPSDYAEATAILTFNPGETVVCSPFLINDDQILEDLEDFRVVLSTNDPRVTVNPSEGTVTIVDDDDIMATIGFREPSYTVMEGQGSVTVEVELRSGTIPPGNEVVVTFSTANQGALAPGDYTSRQMPLTFSSTSTRIPVTIPIIDDSDIEDIERFLANLQIDANDFPDITVEPEQATIDIISNDVRIGFTQTENTVSEADTGVALTLRVLEGTISPQLGNIPVTVSTADVTATDGADYFGFSGQTFTFNSGQMEQTFSIPLVEDRDIEPTEQFAAIATSTVGGVTISPNRAIVNIQDNDVVIGFSQTALTVDEDAGTVELFVTVMDGAIPPGQNRVVMLSTSDGTATASDDYIGVSNRLLTFSSSQPTDSVTITINDDTEVEDALERFTASLTIDSGLNLVVTLLPDTATVTIDDNDVVIGFVDPTTTVTESGEATLFVTIMDGTIPSGEQYIVTLTTADDTANRNDDYEPTTETLTFTSSTRLVQVTVPIIDDDDVEGTEMFRSSLRVDTSRFPVTLSPDTSDIIILDNDVVIGLDMTAYTTEEGTAVALVARVLDGVITQNTIVFLTTSDETATSPDDYEGLNRIPLTFPPGAVSRSVTLRTVEDNDVEDRETLTATLTVDNDVYPGVSLRPDSASIDIIDDDTVTVVLSTTEYRVVENEAAVQVCVDLQPQDALQRALEVTLSTTPRTASDGPDFTGQDLTLTFNEGIDQICRDIPITNDEVTETDEETFEVVISSTDPQADVGTPNRANVIIEDDDRAVIGFEETEYTVSENGGSVPVVVSVLEGELSEDVTIVFSTEDGTATRTFPVDYTATTRTLVFGPGNTEQTIAVPISNDQVLEDIENFFANLVLLRNPDDLDVSVEPSRTEITITDFGDDVEIGLERTSYTTEEEVVNVEVCARIQRGMLEREVQVDLQTFDGTAVSTGSNADYTSSSVTLTFDGSNTLECVRIPIIDDDDLEPNEMFTVSLTTTEPDVTLNPRNGEVIILNRDEVTIGFGSPIYSVEENEGPQEVCVVVMSGGFQIPVRVTVNSRDGSASLSSDYTAVNNRVLTFEPGSTEECFDVGITDDTVDEEDTEDLFLTITTNQDGVILTPDTTRVVITDEDQVVIGFELTTVTVTEQQDSAELCASIMVNTLARTVDVTLSTQPGTATANVDYSSVSNAVFRFSPSVTRQCTTVAIREDNAVEPDSETFTATLVDTPSEGIILRPDLATVTILDETIARFGFERTMYTEVEGNMEEVCVVLQSPIRLDRTVTPRVTSQDITATAQSDYVAVDIEVPFTPGSTRECFNVNLLSDDILEETEQLGLNLVQTEERMSFDPQTTVVNILNEGQVVIGLENVSYTVSEGTPTREVCAIIREGSVDRDVVVTLSTQPRSASGGGVDYGTSSVDLVFNSGTPRACTQVPIVDDDIDEDDEMFDVTLTTTETGISLAPDQGMVTITDDDVVTIGLVPTSITVSEDDGEVEFCAGVTGDVTLGRSVQVTLSTRPGSATATADYGSRTETLVFDSSNTTQCVAIPIMTDTIVEGDEIFTVVLESPDDVNLMPDMGTVTINDTSVVTPEFDQSSYTVPEDDGPVEVCLDVPVGQIQREAVVQLVTMPGTATSGVDYDAGPYSVTFTVGSTSQCVEIGIPDDGTPEDDETVVISIPPSPDVSPPDPTTITIIDDDVVIGFEETMFTVRGDDRQVELTVSVLEGEPSGDVVVRLNTRDNTATSPADYSPIDQLLTFSPSRTSVTIPIDIATSVLNEQGENFFADLTLVSSGDDNVILEPDEAEVMIIQVGAVRIGFERTEYVVNEGDGSVTVVVRVLNGTLNGDVEVEFNTIDGSATTLGPDYARTTPILTFGTSTTNQSVTIIINDDDVVETVEDFIANLTLRTLGANVVLNPSITTVNINDNDVVTPEFDQSSYTVPEDDGPVEVCLVVPDGQIEREAVVQLVTMPGTATSGVDYDAGPYSVTFTVGSTSQCVEIGIPDDGTPEDDETVVISIPPSPDVSPPDPTTITIIDDDVVIGFERTIYTVGGDDGQVVLTVSVLEGEPSGDVVVRLRTRDNTATSPADYSPIDQLLTFSPSRTSVTVPIDIATSVLNEQGENFFADLTLVSSGDDNVILEPDEAEVMIIQVGAARIGFERTEYVVDEEDGSVTVVVRVLDGTLSGDVEVEFNTIDGSATTLGPDYARTTPILTFGPSTTSQSVTIIINDDDVVETVEDFIANLTLRTLGANVVLNPSITTVNINDNDVVTPEFDQSSYTVPEDDGPVEVCLVVPDGQIEREAVVQLVTMPGTATSGVDYDAGPYSVTFTVGSTRQCVEIGIPDDATPEDDETVVISIPPSPDVSPPDPTTITIIDDDVVIGFERTIYTVGGDDGQVELTVSVLEGVPSGDVVVRLNTRDNTATTPDDYSPVDELLTFSPSRTSVTIPINIAPSVLNEQGESFFADLTLVSSGDDNVILEPDEAEVLIAPVGAARIGFESTEYVVDEGDGSVTVVVRVLDGPLSGDVEVEFTTADVSATSSAPVDYTSTSRTLTFGPSTTSQSVNIPINNDDVVETVENFIASLTLGTEDANVVINPARTTVSINDNDVFNPSFQFPEYTVVENEGPVTVCLLVPAGQLERAVSVTFATFDLLATASQDYMPQDLQLTFEPGDTRQCRLIPIIDDPTPEDNEPFTVRVTVPDGPVIETIVTIIDDDEECLQLPDIPFGSVTQTGRQVGDTATYTCDPGFDLIGSPTRTCTQTDPDTADFNGQEPVCRPQCVDLPDIPFGSVSQTGIAVGDTATYTCDPGFDLIGPPTRACTQIAPDTADFNGQEPVCRPQCVDLPDIPFGSVSQTGIAVGDTATYTCDPGFDLIGPPARTCTQTSNGGATFSGDAPTCRPQCVDLPDIPFGSVSQTGIAVGDTATYTCDPGFDLIGSPTRACTQTDPDTADFNGQEPVCRPQCEQLLDIPFGSVSQTGIAVGDTATYTCDPGFDLIGPPARTCTQTSNGGATFSGDAPTCRPQCERLPDIQFGSVSLTGIAVGDTATYTCDPGFEPVGGTPTRTCTQISPGVATFSGDAPTCRPLCEDPPEIVSGTVTPTGNSVGDTTTYSCDPGFNVVGTTTLICQQVSASTAEWMPDPPTCERITVRFALPSYTFTESGVQGSIDVIRTGVPSSPFSIRVTGGPSTQPNIEQSAPVINELITFLAGPGAPDTITITFPLTDDDVALEDIERFFVGLMVENPDSGVIITQPERTQINVLDDDGVTVEFGSPEASFNESDGVYRMCIVKDRETAQRVTVQITDTPGTADRNQDYSPVPLRLVSIEPDNLRTCFTGLIIDDLIGGEGVEFFNLNIPSPTQPGVNVGLDITTINIIDDDVVTVVMVRPTQPVPEVSGEATVCARKDIATAGPVDAIITTSPGKAADGSDYVGGSYTVTFGPEPNAIACATIGIVVDGVFEDIENFDTNLLPPGTGNVVVGPQDTTIVLIDDLGDDVVNDTLIGDPLLTVPLPENSLVAVPGVREASLCYEVHGKDDAWFNVLSDGCVSVNAHYFRFDDNFNFVDKIAIRAVDERGNCKNILIDLNGCSTSIDGTVVQATAPYCTDGVFVRPSRQANRVRVSVPNCNETSNLVMWTICQRNTLMDPFDMMRTYTVDMLKFVIARGSSLGASSHGIIGQFWNIPISLSIYSGEAADAEYGQRYMIQVNHPDSEPRIFTGLLADYSWERDRSSCFYVGNRQAGTIMEVQDPNDPVIEGSYSDYETASDFSTDFKFSHFDEGRCL